MISTPVSGMTIGIFKAPRLGVHIFYSRSTHEGGLMSRIYIALFVAFAVLLVPFGASAQTQQASHFGMSVKLLNSPTIQPGVPVTLKFMVTNSTTKPFKKVQVVFEPGEVLMKSVPAYKLVRVPGKPYKAGMWAITLAAKTHKTFYVTIRPTKPKASQTFIIVSFQATDLGGTNAQDWQRYALKYPVM